MRKIGIFGGSFNPIHNGHLLAMQIFQRELNLDLLLVIPAGIPPHKQLAEGSPSADLRCRLVQTATQAMPGVQVLDLELRRSGKSYSFDTLTELKKQYPNDELFLLMGTDMFLSFEQWYRYEDILSLAEIAVIQRYDAEEQYAVQIQRLAAQFSDNFAAKIHILKSEHIELSSTRVRRLLFFGCGYHLVPEVLVPELKRSGVYAAKHCAGLSFPELVRCVTPLYEPKRLTHAIGCAKTASELAERYGENTETAARAGILHDITKALRGADQFALCERFGIPYDSETVPDVLHGYTAAAAASELFGESENVCSAIRWHTTGRADMTTLEKILYLADYIEPNRDFPDVYPIRELAKTSLDDAVLLGLELSIQDLKQRGKKIDIHSAEAYEFLKSERT